MPGAVVSGGTLWRSDEAPPEVIEAARRAEEDAERDLAEFGPNKPLTSALVYGRVPSGYREDAGAPKLGPGTYGVIVFAEQGHGSTKFAITAS
jgi:hypothetical protein